MMVNLGSSWFPGTFYFLLFHLGQFQWKTRTCISIARVVSVVKCLKSLGTNSRIWSAWKLEGNLLGHLVEMPCWQMWRLAQNVGDSSRWKNSPEQKIPAFWLRPKITLLVVKFLGPGPFPDPVCGFASVGEKRQGQEMLISWWPPGIQDPWRWTALLLLLLGSGMQRPDMKKWPLGRLPLGDEIGKTFDEKPHMYLVFQSFGTIPRFTHTFTPLWCFICTTQVGLCFQYVSRMPAGFLENLKQMDKLYDLNSHPLKTCG